MELTNKKNMALCSDQVSPSDLRIRPQGPRVLATNAIPINMRQEVSLPEERNLLVEGKLDTFFWFFLDLC